jgi:hypothetical protein
MTSLSEVYEGGVGSVVGRRQRILGVTLFLAGTAMVVGAIPIATTQLAAWLDLGVYEARELAGILAGVGVPAVFVGIFVVLPARRPVRVAGAVGSLLAVVGVALFSYAYPYNWLATDSTLALATTATYSLGTLITFWCLFVGVATFKRRNDPGGTARVEITEEGQVRVVSTESSFPGFGSVGLFGSGPSGTVPTQTNSEPDSQDMVVPEPTTSSVGPSGTDRGGTPTSDGGSAVAESGTVEDDVAEAATERGQPDKYCGNCEHFKYVRADGELRPYCGFDEQLMENMDACEDWQGNS